MTRLSFNRARPLLYWAAFALPVLLAFVAHATPAPPAKVRYNRDVRPILAENCFACHGPDSAARQADLRLDKPELATANRNGHAPVVKGNPATSEVIRRVTGQGPIMPPGGRKRLTPVQIAALKRWIAEGAEYERHWSYIAPVRPAVPQRPNDPTTQRPSSSSRSIWTWCRNPIDNFVLDKLLKAGLTPAPEADRRTLARRLSLDLVGLPPEPADVDAFVRDKSPDAYERLVDKYLASPHWGEHRGRYWLDAARYADTHGIHMDFYREMYSYRDWVIKAFNKNIPFDQFTIEQLAGDVIADKYGKSGTWDSAKLVAEYPHLTVPESPLEYRIATGFNRCNITSNEGGMISEEYLVLYARDRTETTSAVWLGSTLNCCVCHDHKFDPFTQRDFYAMSALFNNTTQAAGDGNIKDTPPVIPVLPDEDQRRLDAVKAELASVRQESDRRKQAARGEFDKWLGQANTRAPFVQVPVDGLRFHALLSEGQGREIQASADGKFVKLAAAADPGWTTGHVAAKAFERKAGSVVETPLAGDFEKNQSFTCAAWVKLADANQGGAIVARMDDQHDYRGWDLWLEGGKPGTHIINKWPEDALKVVSRQPIKPKEWHHVAITYGGGANIESVRVYVDGQPMQTDVQANALKSTIRTAVPFKIGQRHSTAGVDGTTIQDVRLYDRALSQEEVGRIVRGTRVAWLASRDPSQLAVPEKDELFAGWLTERDEPYRTLTAKITALEGDQRTILMRSTVAHVMQEKPDQPMAYVLFRGDYDKRKDKVTPATPAILPPLPPDYPKDRLGFAKWLLRPEHPLTARVTVNRFWQELFGNGIVRTSGDFGVTGEAPMHPELLDWLAVEFRESGWDVKKFFKLLVTSATYRQAAITTTEKAQKDLKNRLLSRGPRFRMDAEMVRDYALASSGLLVRKLGGPSVRPYQPDGVWEAVAMIGSDTRDYKRDSGEKLYRRSLYTFWKRSAPPASLDIFNAPNRETCTVRRERTNTPLQALVTLNDIQYIEAARNLAERALKEGGPTPDSQVDYVARRLLARPLRAEEQPVVRKSLANLASFYESHPKEAGALIMTGESKADPSVKPERLAAWTMLCNQMMNLDEVLNK